MGDTLSQEQIEALLKAAQGGDTEDNDTNQTLPANTGTSSESQQNSNDSITLSATDLGILGEVYNISMGAAATAVSSLLRTKVDITTPTVQIIKKSDLIYKSLEPAIAVEIKYILGIIGSNTFILSQNDIMKIVDIMMGGTGQIDETVEFNDIHISAVSEMMNQMMGASSSSLSKFLNIAIDMSPPEAHTLDGDYKMTQDDISSANEDIVMAKFKLIVGDVINSEMILTASMEFAQDMINKAMKSFGMVSEEPVKLDNEEMAVDTSSAMLSQAQIEAMLQKEEPQSPPVQSSSSQTEPPRQTQQVPPTPQYQQTQQAPQQQYQQTAQAPPRQQSAPPVDARPAVFSSFDTEPNEQNPYDTNLDLIMDIPLNVTVEIGRTKKMVQEVLDLGSGSLIVLDRQAGDPVDVFINGSLVAKGSVIVIEENYAIKITEIISMQEKTKIAKNNLIV